MSTLNLELSSRPTSVNLAGAIIAGWAGRDKAAVQKHIDELMEIGVAPPKTTPVFYHVSASRLTCAPEIEVMGEDSSGEVECVLLMHDGGLYVGVGSDHTDRKAEAVGVTLSKQLCDKPIGARFWRFDEVIDHWDHLQISSYILKDGERETYQHGSLSELLPPATLLEKFGKELPENTVMFCGTVPVIGQIRGASSFEIVLEDPVLNRSISHQYGCVNLPVAG